jgi:DNA-binding NarL/FixJ family response regulator
MSIEDQLQSAQSTQPEQPMQLVRVLLADDHRMLRESLRRSLEDHNFEVVGEASNGSEAVRLATELQPDVILMDVSMPVLNGIEATRLVRQRGPHTQVIILTMHNDEKVRLQAIRAGAAGFLVKDCSIDEVVTVMSSVAQGVTLSPEVAASMLGEVRRLEQTPVDEEPLITKREEDVLQCIADGLSTQEVASHLYISVKTVKNHLASIYQKLDSRDRTQAVLRAVRMGIIRLS